MLSTAGNEQLGRDRGLQTIIHTLQTTTTTTTTTSSSSSYHYYPSSSVSGGREDSRVLCPATILVFIQNTHIDSWAENPTTYSSRVECSKVLCPDREFYALDTQCCRGRMQCESNYDYQCTCHSSTHQTQIMIQASYLHRYRWYTYVRCQITSTSTPRVQVQVTSHATLAPGTARAAPASYGRIHTATC